MILKLIPKIFFDTLDQALDLFVDGLGFTIVHQDATLLGVKRDGAAAYLVADPIYAARDRPEITLETDDIAARHAEIATRRPDLLHPNLPDIRSQPWGAQEFALLDPTGICIVFRQWPSH